MDKVSILLVDNPCLNITKIDSALSEAGLDHTLYFAASGKHGLDILMGDPYHEATADVKIKPQVVILSKEIKDIPAAEFIGIVRKYYSLRDIKIFLLSDSLTDAERFVYEELGVSGYLQRPLDKEQVTSEIRPQVSSGRTHFAFIPVVLSTKPVKMRPGAFIKAKIVSAGAGAKIAACIVSALMISGVARYNTKEPEKEDITAHVVKMPEPVADQIQPPDPLPFHPDEALSLNKKSVPQKKTTPREENVAVVTPPSDSDSAEVMPQKSENRTQPDKLRNLRIIAVEAPDSIPE